MIKKFNQFDSINELKFDTYLSASKKLRKLGGNHAKRSEELEKWAFISDARELGEFNMNFDIVEITKDYSKLKSQRKDSVKFTQSIPIGSENKPSAGETWKIIKSSPNIAYITSTLIDEPNEIWDDITDMDSIGFCIQCIAKDGGSDPFYCFYMQVKVIWEGDMFKIVDGSCELSECANDYSGLYLFADRKSALKFKNKFLDPQYLNKIEGMEQVHETFLEYSTGEEWKKYFDELKSISINKLWK